ncbi:MAG: BamA/TamA family outer membrane protein [candidate division Zixibacteria bacterium]|nr:BamA/TamA family outer membrane protein [candidate division Zixibacteria bacterium]
MPVKMGGGHGSLDKGMTGQIMRLAGRSRPDSLIHRVESLLDDAGYFHRRVEIIGDTLVVDPGPAYMIGGVRTTIVGADGSVGSEQTNRYDGLPAGRGTIERIKNGLVDGYRADGHYFVSLTPQPASLQDHRLDLEFKIIAGPLVRVERVRFKGLTRTDPRFAERLTGLKPGRPFRQNELDHAVDIVQRTGFMAVDTMPYILPNEQYDAVEVVFPVRDLKANSLELGGGYLPRQNGKSGELVGRFDFRSRNLFGTGRKLQALFDRKDRASSRMVFAFGQPLFIPDYLEAAVRLEQIDYDSSYQSFAAEGTLTMAAAGNTRVSAGVGWTRTEPQRSSQNRSQTLAGTISLIRESRDHPANPSHGYLVGIDAAYLRRSSRPDTSLTDFVNNETTFGLRGESYVQLYRAWIIRVNIQTRLRLTSRDLIDYSEMFKLGGYGSLRGYRQDEFAGRRAVLAQAELRWRPSSELALYLFGDWGYVYDKQQNGSGEVSAFDLNRWGRGGGIYVGGEATRITMEFGWGEGDRLGEGKLHVGLATFF